MPRKPISEQTPEEAEATREYMRKAKAKSRASGVTEKRKPDTRVRGSRAAEQRERRRKKREELNNNGKKK